MIHLLPHARKNSRGGGRRAIHEALSTRRRSFRSPTTSRCQAFQIWDIESITKNILDFAHDVALPRIYSIQFWIVTLIAPRNFQECKPMETERAQRSNMDDEAEDQILPIEDYILGSIPTLLYIPNFITAAEEEQLLHHVYDVPASKWKIMKNRRLQNWGGVVHEKGLFSQELPPWLLKITGSIQRQIGLFPSAINHVLINEYLPDQGIMAHQDGPAYFPVVAILSLKSPVVIDFTPHPRLSDNRIDSNGEETLSKDQVCPRKSNEGGNSSCSLLLMPCSLLVFKDQAYSDYLHGILDSQIHSLDKVANSFEAAKLRENNMQNGSGGYGDGCIHRSSNRISLTCRLVPKVHRKLFKF